MKRYKWSDYQITEWHKRTFPDCDYVAQMCKLNEEIHEAYAEEGKNYQRWIEEMADVSIAAAALDMRFQRKIGQVVNCYLRGLPEACKIMEARDAKMDINTQRIWEGNHHV